MKTLLVWILAWSMAASAETIPADSPLTNWTPVTEGFVLEPGPPGSWDEQIRERMWVLYEDGLFKAWYAGFSGPYDQNRENLVHLGYATSTDGVQWTKHPDNPIFSNRWTEDMCVVKKDGVYHMFVEDETKGETYIYLMTSPDGLEWSEQGKVIGGLPGSGWEEEWAGTPLVWVEGEDWYMLYEGGPPGDIALATSDDGRTWSRFEGNPVLTEGTGWDSEITAPDAIIKREGLYYLFYHAWSDAWRTGLAVSRDLKTWTRYEGNPMFDNPSPVLVETEDRFLMYVTHERRNGKNGILLYEAKR